ncbi:MAG: hypothetical protein ABMA13_08230 [Chthoniobacteraceae bacterium]
MKYAILIARILLGLIFLLSLDYWFHFIPQPKVAFPEQAMSFIGLLAGSGYLGAVKVCELIGSLLVLSGRFICAGLLFLGPIILNILFFDLFLAKTFNPMSTFAAVLALFLLWAHRERFAPLCKA